MALCQVNQYSPRPMQHSTHVHMILSLVLICIGLLGQGALSWDPEHGNHHGCDNACFSGFQDIQGIASLCNNANRPTKTISVDVTAKATSTITITIPQYRYTFNVYTTPSPTSIASCISTASPFTKTRDGNFIVGESYASLTTSTPVAVKARNGCPGCPGVKEAVLSACKCFFPAGPEQTVYVTHTVTTVTSYATQQTVSFNYMPLTRTIAAQCTSAPIYGKASYNICGSRGVPLASYEECKVPFNTTTIHDVITNPYQLDWAYCCSACYNTLDCFQAFTDYTTNTCILNIRTAKNSNTNITADCPNGHTFITFAESRSLVGFLRGHCSAGCGNSTG